MTDIFTQYEKGLDQLLEKLTENHPRYGEALALQVRLWRNIAQVRQHGDNKTCLAERLQIVTALDQLTLEAINTSFNQLCWTEEDTNSTDPQAVAQILLDHITLEPDGSQTLSLNETLAQELLTAFRTIQANTDKLATLVTELNQGISITGDGNIVGNHNQVIIVKDNSKGQDILKTLIRNSSILRHKIVSTRYPFIFIHLVPPWINC